MTQHLRDRVLVGGVETGVHGLHEVRLESGLTTDQGRRRVVTGNVTPTSGLKDVTR